LDAEVGFVGMAAEGELRKKLAEKLGQERLSRSSGALPTFGPARVIDEAVNGDW